MPMSVSPRQSTSCTAISGARAGNYKLQVDPIQAVFYRRPEWQRVPGGELCWINARWEYRSKGKCVAYWYRHDGELLCENTAAHANGIEDRIRRHCEVVIRIVDKQPFDWPASGIAEEIREIAEECSSGITA